MRRCGNRYEMRCSIPAGLTASGVAGRELRSGVYYNHYDQLVRGFERKENKVEKEKNQWDALFGRHGEASALFRKDFEPAETLLEKELAEIWQTLLNYDKVSLDDNFLDLGGNSLLLTQLLSRISENYAISLTFKELLSTKLTIEEQAKLIEKALFEQTDPAVLNELITEIGLSTDSLAGTKN